jgi:hypothetical protein
MYTAYVGSLCVGWLMSGCMGSQTPAVLHCARMCTLVGSAGCCVCCLLCAGVGVTPQLRLVSRLCDAAALHLGRAVVYAARVQLCVVVSPSLPCQWRWLLLGDDGSVWCVAQGCVACVGRACQTASNFLHCSVSVCVHNCMV